VSNLREPLSERRFNLIEKAYMALDPENTGYASIEGIQNSPTRTLQGTNTFQNPFTTLQTRINQFWETFKNYPDLKVPRNDFFAYWEDVSLATPSDEQFIQVITKTFGITETDDAQIRSEEIKEILRQIRYKLIQKTKGIQDEILLRKLFVEYDTSKSGYLTLDELQAMMIKLDIPI